MDFVTVWKADVNWSSGEDTLGDCAPSGLKIPLMTWPPLTWGKRCS